MLLETPLWRQTPPAIFPVCLGFMSLALGWRNAADLLPWLSEDVGNIMLALSTAFFLWFLMFYLAKVAARPMVVLEDMRTPPARAGMAAAAMAMMVLAAALLPLNIRVPPVWWLGVFMQVFASAVVLYAIWKDPPGKRHFSTFQYLTFVGPVVGPIAGVPLGYVRESIWLITAALVAYVIVTIGIFWNLKRDPIPEKLRPSVMIFLAPISLFALGYGALGWDNAFHVFYYLGDAVMIILILMMPWMMKGGFSPVWASFTFPIAAYLNVQLLALAMGHGLPALIGVYGGLILGTPLILWIAYRSIMTWVTGDLSRQSHAAVA